MTLKERFNIAVLLNELDIKLTETRTRSKDEYNKYTRSKDFSNKLMEIQVYLENKPVMNEDVRLLSIETVIGLQTMDKSRYDSIDTVKLIHSVNNMVTDSYTNDDIKVTQKFHDDEDSLRVQKSTTEKEMKTLKSSTLGNVKKLKDEHHWQNTYTSYSGADMVCSVDIPGQTPYIIGELTELSYSIFRAKTPVRSLGFIRSRGFTRGMRVVSGILTFGVFDQSIVDKLMRNMNEAGYDILLDELPTFNITISFRNEYGSRSKLVVYGVTITTEGMVTGINDIYLQKACQFYALDVSELKKER